ncbi:MAG TPA: hypothetical protein EYP85_01880 [Armatimonadetes bacterium]|nr:hypothetical protein [Armatimonadota bacterium]
MKRKFWGPYVVIGGLVLATTTTYLSAAGDEFPLDDAYIHFVYAEHLAQQGELSFNRGEPGVGTTSILWVLLLAGLHCLGLPTYLGARLVGLLSLFAVGCAAYELARATFVRWERIEPTVPAQVATGLVLLSGNLLWFTLSGMETMLFLALGLGALVLYLHRQFVPLGIVLGLLSLTRIEGLALLIVIGLVELLSERRPTRPVLLIGLLATICLAPWVLYLHGRTGLWLPTSFAGKKWAQLQALQAFASRSPLTAPLLAFKPVLYLSAWFFYTLLFVLGGIAWPGPRWPVGRLIGSSDITLSWVGLGFGLGLVPLFKHAVRCSWEWLRRRCDLAQTPDRVLLAFLGWVALHNLAYMFILPILGTASRYGALNHVVLWLAIAVGLFAIPRPRCAFRLAAAVVAVVALTDTIYWGRVYAANVEHTRDVRVRAAQFVARYLPPQAVVAAHDIGVVKYFIPQRVVDLGGLTDPAFVGYEKEGRVAEYLRERGVDYLLLPDKHSTEEKPAYDYRQALGLRNCSDFVLEEIAAFENDRRRWALGSVPTWNALPSVHLYRLRWK